VGIPTIDMIGVDNPIRGNDGRCFGFK